MTTASPPASPPAENTRLKEMKVKIPVNHHIRLHAMRVFNGKPISDAVTEALDAYFGTASPPDVPFGPPDSPLAPRPPTGVPDAE